MDAFIAWTEQECKCLKYMHTVQLIVKLSLLNNTFKLDIRSKLCTKLKNSEIRSHD